MPYRQVPWSRGVSVQPAEEEHGALDTDALTYAVDDQLAVNAWCKVPQPLAETVQTNLGSLRYVCTHVAQGVGPGDSHAIWFCL